MNHFCTLFDSNYLSRGLLLYESLVRQEPSSHLFIFAFDDHCHRILKQLQLSNATIVALRDFENEQLLAVKKIRTPAEYCWTCTPSIIAFTIMEYQVESCTYLDADLYFYDSPSVLINEMPPAYSVLITPHRYTRQYDQSATSGIYCVQFLTFKNNPDSLKVLLWWKNACLQWCYNRVEDGKFGDQKYLDDWTTRFNGIVWSLNNLGGGVAPWNVQQYEFFKKDGTLQGTENEGGMPFALVFFHFHGLYFKKNISSFGEKQLVIYRTGYDLPESAVNAVYEPYARLLLAKAHEVQHRYKLKIHNSSTTRINLKDFLKQQVKKLLINR